MFGLRFFGVSSITVLLFLTTIVSLEAIYLSIFIQMTVNQQAKELEEVSEDIEEIQEDVEGIQKDVDEIQEDVEEIQEDVEEIQEEVKDQE
jgi:peptidoglycan hydrolase CwlO-like protein